MDIRQLCLFCLSFLSALGVYAQAEQKDSTVQDNKGVNWGKSNEYNKRELLSRLKDSVSANDSIPVVNVVS